MQRISLQLVHGAVNQMASKCETTLTRVTFIYAKFSLMYSILASYSKRLRLQGRSRAKHVAIIQNMMQDVLTRRSLPTAEYKTEAICS